MTEEIRSAYGHTDPSIWVWNSEKHVYEYHGPNRVILVIKAVIEWIITFLWFKWHLLTDRVRDEVI